MGFNISTKKILSASNIKKIIELGISLRDELSNMELGLISDYDSTKTYTRGQAVYYDNYLYKCLYTTTGDFDESKWQLIGDNLSLITKQDIEAMINLSDEDVKTLQSLILDTSIELSHVWSSSKTYGEIQNAIKKGEAFTLSKLASTMTASFEIATSTTDMTEGNILYLLNTGTNTYDIYALIGGNPTVIASTTIDLSQFYTKTEIDNNFVKKTDADGKYATITTVDGKVDKTSILSTISSTPSDDKLLSEKAVNDELNKKIDKSNIVTTIDSTVTNEQIPSARAVLDSKSAKRMNESINPENYEVGDWYAEGYDGVLLSTSDGHPCSEWHIGYVVTGFKTSDGKGYKKILAITMNGNCYVKVQKWDKWSGWQRLCSTSVKDVAKTDITFIDSNVSKIENEICQYCVLNNICYVTLNGLTFNSSYASDTTFANLPKPVFRQDFALTNSYGDVYLGKLYLEVNGTIHLYTRTTPVPDAGFISFSYPVASQ